MNEVYFCVLSRIEPIRGYKTPFKCFRVVTNALYHSGSGLSSSGSEDGVFCLYMKVSRKSAMSCEHQ